MKKHLVCLASLLLGLCAMTVVAQRGPPQGPQFDGAMEKLFGENSAFSAGLQFQTADGSGRDVTMNGKIAHSGEKSRLEFDLSEAQGANIPPQAVAQMKQWGMSRMAVISSSDKKVNYMIYPDAKSYVELPTPNASTSAKASDYKMTTTKVGEETVDGHACVKNKVVETGPDGASHDATVWNATDLKDFPVKIQTETKSGNFTMLFKDIKLTAPPASQFDLPSGYTKYASMMELMMSHARQQQ